MDDSNNLNENLYSREAGPQSPKIVLDKKNNKFEFSGNSLPEDALSFYMPIIDWFELYKKAPNEKAIITFKLAYMNSATAKMIHKVIEKLNELYMSGVNLELHWHYDVDDEDMLSDVKILLEGKSIPYKLIGHDD